MQILALKEEYVDEFIISSPTSSGKTLVAEIYMQYNLGKRRRVILYRH